MNLTTRLKSKLELIYCGQCHHTMTSKRSNQMEYVRTYLIKLIKLHADKDNLPLDI